MARLYSFLLMLIVCCSAQAQTTHSSVDPPDWSKEYAPFRIVGNVYYVGTYDLACYLVVTSKGNILINTGLASSADMIKASVEKLGFKMQDIKILLTTQAHYDHVAAMASIQKLTGAQMMVNKDDAPVMADGGKSDHAFGENEHFWFEPVKTDKLLNDGDIIALGETRITMLDHPGHTKGSASYMLDVKDENKTYRVLLVNLPSIVVSKKFSEIAEYPGIAEDYAKTLAALKGLKFDLWLSSHANQFNLHSKRKPGDKYNPEVFADREGYDAAVKSMQASYDKKIKE
jgi:metallo-beta-lactamase class B